MPSSNAPPSRRAEGEDADRPLPGGEGEEGVRAQPLLEQPHVLEVAVLVHEVLLQHGAVVEGDEPGTAAHDGQHAAEAPRRALGVAHHLDVVAGVVHEAAGQAVEALEGLDLGGEGGDDPGEVAARGRGGSDPPEHVGAGGGGAQLRVEPGVLDSRPDLLAEHLEEVLVERHLRRAGLVEEEDAERPPARPQGGRGEPARPRAAPGRAARHARGRPRRGRGPRRGRRPAVARPARRARRSRPWRRRRPPRGRAIPPRARASIAATPARPARG